VHHTLVRPCSSPFTPFSCYLNMLRTCLFYLSLAHKFVRDDDDVNNPRSSKEIKSGSTLKRLALRTLAAGNVSTVVFHTDIIRYVLIRQMEREREELHFAFASAPISSLKHERNKWNMWKSWNILPQSLLCKFSQIGSYTNTLKAVKADFYM